MTQFDISGTVNNLLSGGGDAASEGGARVISTAAGMANLPGVDVARLTSLVPELTGVLTGALGAVPGVGEALDIFGVSKPRAPKSRQIQRRQFNPFNLADAHGAVVMASKLMEIADRKGGNAGLADAIGAVAAVGELVGEGSGLVGGLVGGLTGPIGDLVGEVVSDVVGAVGAEVLGLIGLRQQALTLFITHHPAAHQQLKLKPLDQREPNLVSRAGSRAYPEAENQLNYWREDAQLNEHHGRWHDVYPLGGRPTASGSPALGDRNGELFGYMHVQMLARYDTERLCGVGLSRVKPYDYETLKLDEGYDPGKSVMQTLDRGKTWIEFTPRGEGEYLRDVPDTIDETTGKVTIPGTKIEDQKKFREALRTAASDGHYKIKKEKDGQRVDVSVDVSSDNFGNTIEASIGSIDYPDKENIQSSKNGKNYGNYHSDGHTLIGYFQKPEGPSGVISNLFTTARDPMFWRWHKHVDTIIQKWREKQQPHDFSGGPLVVVRSKDIILCGEGGLPGMEKLPAGFNEKKLSAAAFGYSEDPSLNRWDGDFSSGVASATIVVDQSTRETVDKTITTTAELWTEFRKREIYPQTLKDVKGELKVKTEREVIEYLSHDDFSYFIRLQNRSDQPQQVTIRIFLAPESWVKDNKDNTVWIEMDRFMQPLDGGERAVVFRPARLSAVIRKPAIGHEELEGKGTESRGEASAWCDCGWPYTLLLPRGTEKGMDFRLLVMLSGDDLAMDDTGKTCTSMSYCGLESMKYPDKRPMGYPFDRPLPDSIDAIIEKHENWASRTIQIRCRNPK